MTARTHMIGGLRTFALALALLFAGLNGAAAQQQSTDTLNNQQIEQLVAPIALYPDDLLSQVLMASTYPLEVVEAARWVKENPNVTGQALQDAMQKQPWDPSVKSIAAVPQTLAMMNDQIKWTQKFGDAFLRSSQRCSTPCSGCARARTPPAISSRRRSRRSRGSIGRPTCRPAVARPRRRTRSCRAIPRSTSSRSTTRPSSTAPGRMTTTCRSSGLRRLVGGGVWLGPASFTGAAIWAASTGGTETACQSAPLQPVQSHQHHEHELAAQRRASGRRPVPQRQRRQTVRRWRQGRGARRRSPGLRAEGRREAPPAKAARVMAAWARWHGPRRNGSRRHGQGGMGQGGMGRRHGSRRHGPAAWAKVAWAKAEWAAWGVAAVAWAAAEAWPAAA